jgi:hypothetical protein
MTDTTEMTTAELLEHYYALRDWTAYHDILSQRRTNNHRWFKNRVKQLGYKSIAEFCEKNPQGVVAGTVSGWFKGHSTINIGNIARLCYGLRVSPNDLLTVLGYYDPKKQTIQSLSGEDNE